MHFQYPGQSPSSRPLFQAVVSTPHKRVKPNEDSTFEHSKVKPPKISLLQKLNDQSFGLKKESRTMKDIEITEFDLPMSYKSSNSGSKMDEEIDENKEMKQLNLGRKMTCMDKDLYEDAISTLNLYRSNSTFDQGRYVQDVRLGDNIYLRQINSQQGNIPASTKMINEHEHGLRIEQDYEIQQSLLIHKKRHQNFICLNKLQRIFYYVKKVTLTFEGKENYQSIQELTSLQMKVYHKDNEGSFLRFYQSWFQHNALYLTYEVAIESLQDCLSGHKRLREVEAWDLLKDCTKALSWLREQQNFSHLNIKPGNILKCQRKFKLADPFLSSSVLQAYLKEQGSEWDGWAYLAPEIKRFHTLIQGLDMRKCDIYALGMCLIENLVGERYFPREGRAMRMYLQKHIHGYSPSLIKTLLRMVSLDPTKRPTAEELFHVEKTDVEGEKAVKKRRFSI